MRSTAALSLLALLTASVVVGCAADDAADDGNDDGVTGDEQAFTARPARHAIVLAHGFTGAAKGSIWSYYKVQEALERDGHVVHLAEVAPFKPVATRAEDLKDDVDAALAKCEAKAGCDASKVHIIAHSMGGLDARYLVSKLGYGDRVASITSVATAHRGTAVADVGLKLIRDDGNVDKVLNTLTALLGRTFTERALADDSDLRASLESISEKYARETFNVEVKDDPRVKYMSWAGVSNVAGIPNPKDKNACEGKFAPKNGRDRMNELLVPIAAVVAHGSEFRPNDGMATVESSKWGTFMGCIPADHLDEVGQPKHDKPNVHGGFDHILFYRRIASSLD